MEEIVIHLIITAESIHLGKKKKIQKHETVLCCQPKQKDRKLQMQII